MSKRASNLSQPGTGGVSFSSYYDPDAFGRFSETIARYIGTARFLVIQTAVVVGWIALNAVSESWRFDRYPFILLTLALSLQAAYAAPLILLAQNRQEERDHGAFQADRDRAASMNASLDFLARELVSVRLAVVDAPTHEEMERLVAKAVRDAMAVDTAP
ncbi:DUF1003 domain-containing protein [Aquihabitans sp. McL0605]|uniref:DUF1003 domain-containing protein n=1 Tax=Aquihabitans sp. McL0605 TaxID=3415671 RepID=UPI003CF3B010